MSDAREPVVTAPHGEHTENGRSREQGRPVTDTASVVRGTGLRRVRLRRRLGLPNLLVVGLVGLAAIVGLMLGGEQLSGYSASEQSLADRLEPPLAERHLLGTDRLGRDLLARVSAGFQWSLPVGFLSACIATAIGTAIGILAGWTRGIVRTVLTRLIDTAIAFPYFVLAATLVAVAGKSFVTLTLILGLVAWVSVARVVYAETRSLKEREFILAARLVGMPAWRIVSTYVLRGLRTRISVMFAFLFADLLVAEAALSFLGVGAPVGTPSWGMMLAEGRSHIFDAPWLIWAPSAAVVLAVLTANFIGDGLNEKWDVGIEHE